MKRIRKTAGLVLLLLAMLAFGITAQAKTGLSKKKLTVKCGKTATIELKGATGGVKWTTSKSKVGKETLKCKVVVTNGGAAFVGIDASFEKRHSNSKSKSKTLSGSTSKGTVLVTSVSVTAKTIIEVGTSTQASASVSPSNATSKGISWASDNVAVATVDSNGLIRGVSAGTARISATANDGSGHSDWFTLTVKEDQLKAVKQGLATAKSQGASAFIRFCETSPYRNKINIGKYGNRGLGGYVADSDAINVEADYGNAINALYTPWLKSIYEKSWASKTNDMFYKLCFLSEYVYCMHRDHMVYCNRTYGWCLCPAVAQLLKEGMQTHMSGVNGYRTRQSYAGGNCAADASLVMALANYIGLTNTWCEGDAGAYSHWRAYVRIGSDLYAFDAQMGTVYKVVNGTVQTIPISDEERAERTRLRNAYGNQPYTP